MIAVHETKAFLEVISDEFYARMNDPPPRMRAVLSKTILQNRAKLSMPELDLISLSNARTPRSVDVVGRVVLEASYLVARAEFSMLTLSKSGTHARKLRRLSDEL